MKYYVFYDTNVLYDCDEVYDICKDEYRELLKTCFKYSSYFSFMIAGEGYKNILKNLPAELDKYSIEFDENFDNVYRRYSLWTKEICCYIACPETYNLLLSISDSIFKWKTDRMYDRNPEDLTFFRKDGSVFMNSVAHEGECSIYPRPEENITSILSKGNWYIRSTEDSPMTLGGQPYSPNTGDGSMS